MTRPNGIYENISLADYSTMRLGGPARYVADLKKTDDLANYLAWAAAMKLKLMVIGDGNNLIFGDGGFDGLVLRNRIKGIEVTEDSSDFLITVGAGENWDKVVAQTATQGLTGIEALSYIPGTVGAAPIQNIGAYGQEIARVIESVTALNRVTGQLVVLSAEDCEFSYRSSRFNGHDKGTYIITQVVLRLHKGLMGEPYYPDIEQYFTEHPSDEITPAAIRAALKEIRGAKLPDPKVVPNCGSFFYNPIVGAKTFEQIKHRQPNFLKEFPGRAWVQPDGRYKLAAGAMLNFLGFKGYEDADTGMGLWANQALVMYNFNAHSTADLLRFRQKIVDRVKGEFGIELIQEPELV